MLGQKCDDVNEIVTFRDYTLRNCCMAGWRFNWLISEQSVGWRLNHILRY